MEVWCLVLVVVEERDMAGGKVVILSRKSMEG